MGLSIGRDYTRLYAISMNIDFYVWPNLGEECPLHHRKTIYQAHRSADGGMEKALPCLHKRQRLRRHVRLPCIALEELGEAKAIASKTGFWAGSGGKTNYISVNVRLHCHGVICSKGRSTVSFHQTIVSSIFMHYVSEFFWTVRKSCNLMPDDACLIGIVGNLWRIYISSFLTHLICIIGFYLHFLPKKLIAL